MKFAKELEQDLVPEWRAKYLNYKVGKKKLKTITRALRSVEEHHWPTARRNRATDPSTTEENSRGLPSIRLSPDDRSRTARSVRNASPQPSNTGAPATPGHSEPRKSPLVLMRSSQSQREQVPLKSPDVPRSDKGEGYGSIKASPNPDSVGQGGPCALELPGPAVDPNHEIGSQTGRTDGSAVSEQPGSSSGPQNLENRAEHRSPSLRGILPGPRNVFRPRGNSFLDRPSGTRHPSMRYMFSYRGDREQRTIPTEPSEEVRIAEGEFFSFLDRELGKIEYFYKTKEEEATDKLASLRSQLHLMRDTRTEELASKKASRDPNKRFEILSAADGITNADIWKRPLRNITSPPASHGSQTKTTGEIQPVPGTTTGDESKDYVRRQAHPNVPYRSAKRKLKLALLEFYRGLELLKAYADLNRKAFRKMNKKYDKITNARPTGRYMSEKVNKAWFVQSDTIENHLVAVEDLYTRYIERGNRKIAITKLRGKPVRIQDYSSSAFRNGLMLAAGLVLGVQGLVNGIKLLNSGDDTTRIRTSYLFQVYGGYLLVVLHFLFFSLNCMVWTGSKINYAFVFEFDARNVLDWRQLAEIPCFCMLLFGIIFFLNFLWVNEMYIYYPAVLIAVTVVILFVPARILYHRTRKWWAYSNWRLLFSGLYPVEFRDFFMGDMYSSQTYAMGNLALFFCLYSRSWNEPGSCNSSHSRLMGFLTTLPSIWRALQCIRRYQDTKDKFPHIVNLGKYSCSILYYMTLSLYRIEGGRRYRALFIAFACINGLYTSVWDLAMDWSLGNPHSKNPFLRDFLAFRRRWVYYLAMVVDPILRSTWILYAIFTHRVQHSALISFVVSLLEVCRRGMWSIFRVENEHCTNVCRFRASRDIPLPYDLKEESDTVSQEGGRRKPQGTSLVDIPTSASGVDVERRAGTGASLRQRRPSQASEGGPGPGTLSRVGTMLANAHVQDFQRKRSRSVLGSSSQADPPEDEGQDESTDDEDEDDEEEYADDGDEENTQNIQQRRPQTGSGNLFEENNGNDGHVHQS